ncbi:MAG: restriction endonuclease subunit S [Balneolaceae bacterium]|nr:restriction endonuclease subunit S [Balneolaceae bacterium]
MAVRRAYRGVEYSDKPFCVIDTAFYLDLTTNEVLDKWAYYQLKDFDINNIDSGTAIPSTSREAFYQIPVEIPPLEQQKKIVDTLSAFDDLIENNSRRIEILEEMARRIYREWFVHFRYPDHENDELVDSRTELGEIPEGWEVKELEDFGEIVLGKTPSTKDSENYGDYMPFIKTPDMHDQFFIHETENVLSKKGVKTQEKKTLPADSICVSCIGTAGVVAITSVPSQTNQQINSIVPEDKALREYLYFTTKALKPLMEKIGSTGATMTNVSKTKFKGLPALKPSQELLNKFHEKVGSLFDQISTLQKQNIKLKQTRDLLLPKLISGKIDMEEMELAI